MSCLVEKDRIVFFRNEKTILANVPYCKINSELKNGDVIYNAGILYMMNHSVDKKLYVKGLQNG